MQAGSNQRSKPNRTRLRGNGRPPIPHLPRTNHNQLLAALHSEVLERIHPELNLISLPRGSVLHEPGQPLAHIYFLTTCMVSLENIALGGELAELALIGNEGAIGVPLILGGEMSLSRAVVHRTGYAYRFTAAALAKELACCGQLHRLLLLYTQSLFTHVGQTALCNRYHSVSQQLCRWLLLALDRSDGNRIIMTHELLANTLGVRREGITEAARNLQKRGIIHYSRGRITVLDRTGLEALTCECYAVVKAEHTRLLNRHNA